MRAPSCRLLADDLRKRAVGGPDLHSDRVQAMIRQPATLY